VLASKTAHTCFKVHEQGFASIIDLLFWTIEMNINTASAQTVLHSEAAAARVSNQLAKNAAMALRFAAKKSGCSGYSYVLDFANEIDSDDHVFEMYGVTVVVDPVSLPILNGTMIDYVSEGLNQTFKFINPKATDECGCGESFAVSA
jgi:iron-sulfur cluster assembly protein